MRWHEEEPPFTDRYSDLRPNYAEWMDGLRFALALALIVAALFILFAR